MAYAADSKSAARKGMRVRLPPPGPFTDHVAGRCRLEPGPARRRLATDPMLDSRGLTIAVRRDPPTVEDLRSTTVTDDPVQRRDLILLERAREGDLGAFNDLVTLYQDQLFALVVRMVPDRDQASDAVQEAFFSAFRHLDSFRGGSVKSWLNRICVNARHGHPAGPQASSRPALSGARGRELAAAGGRRKRSRADRRRGRTDEGAVGCPGGDHGRSARGHRAVRRRGLRLRRDRGDDRRLPGHGQVADPPWPVGPARPARESGWSCSVAERGRPSAGIDAGNPGESPPV